MPEPLTDRTTQAKEDRIRRLYRRQLDGLSARALVYDHKEKEQISINTAWRDWAEVKSSLMKTGKLTATTCSRVFNTCAPNCSIKPSRRDSCRPQVRCLTPLDVLSVNPLKQSTSRHLNLKSPSKIRATGSHAHNFRPCPHLRGLFYYTNAVVRIYV